MLNVVILVKSWSQCFFLLRVSLFLVGLLMATVCLKGKIIIKRFNTFE